MDTTVNPPLLSNVDTYYKKPLFHGTPGTIYELTLSGDGSIYNRGKCYVDRWHDQAAVTLWQAKHDEVRAELNAEKFAKHDHIISQLQPLAAAYRRLGDTGRAALMIKVVRYISSGE